MWCWHCLVHVDKGERTSEECFVFLGGKKGVYICCLVDDEALTDEIRSPNAFDSISITINSCLNLSTKQSDPHSVWFLFVASFLVLPTGGVVRAWAAHLLVGWWAKKQEQ